MSTNQEKIKVLIERLELVARITEQGKYPESDERELNNYVWFRDMTSYQEIGMIERIESFSSKTGIDVKHWFDNKTVENDIDLLIKY
jgi:hypothetical protein